MIRPDGAESNVQENESIPRVNLTPSKITDEYVECDVRLVAGKESGIGGGEDEKKRKIRLSEGGARDTRNAIWTLGKCF